MGKRARDFVWRVAANVATYYVLGILAALFGAVKTGLFKMSLSETFAAYWQWIPLIVILLVGGAVFRAQKFGMTRRAGGATITFNDGDPVRSTDLASVRHYLIYKGQRHGISGYGLANRAFPKRHYVEGQGLSLLDPNVLRQIPEGRPLENEIDLREIFLKD